MYYYINTLLTRGRLNLFRFHVIHSFIQIANDVSAANWQIISNTGRKSNFDHLEIWFFSAVEIPIRHSSLHNQPIDQLCQPKFPFSLQTNNND